MADLVLADRTLWLRQLWSSFLQLFRGPFLLDEPATPTLPALAALPPKPLAGRPGEHVRLCIDFGTSTSTVARAVLGGEPELAVLQVDPKTGRKYTTIDSDLAWQAGRPAILGATARLVEERGEEGYEVHRSLKRLLSDLRREENSHLLLRLRVEALIEELLCLALCPDQAGTVEKQRQLGIEVDVAAIGLPHRARLADIAARGTLDVHLCVPNAFGNFEAEILRGAAQRAAEAVQKRCGGEPGATVHLVREAEAVAFYALHERHLREDVRALDERWLVFDVGAGSTDAAIVGVELGPEGPRVRTERQAGAAFGGHDVDELLLRLVAEQAGDAVPQGIEQRIDASRSTRASQLRNLSDAKEAWSKVMQVALARISPAEVDAWLAWLERPEGAMPGADILPPIQPHAELWADVREIAAWGPAYAAFLRATVAGVVEALADPPSGPVDRVLLSGRGSQLPGLRSMLARALAAHGLSQEIEPVGDASGLKLACVLGIAVAASQAAMPEDLPEALAEEVSLGRHVTLWPRGHRLADDPARASLRLEGSGPRLVAFYQARCPKAVARALASPVRWEDRPLGAAVLDVEGAVDLTVAFDVRSGQLALWRTGPDGAEAVPLELDPELASGTNPLSGLPFGWVDA